MSCLLCFEYNSDFVELVSDEGIEQQIGSILLRHFQFVFQVNIAFDTRIDIPMKDYSLHAPATVYFE